MAVRLRVNGSVREVDVPADTPLLWVLRDALGLTGTKYGCGIGQCGSCTVHVDGRPTRSCLRTAASAEGAEIVTIEGLSVDGGHPVQRAWVEEDVAQCGYCQAGQIMTAAALLDGRPEPSEDEVTAAMAPILCRCGTYERIRRAVRAAARLAREER